MRFLDPLGVRCPCCAAAMTVGVAELLSLSAQCSACSASLERLGQEMRETADVWAHFAGMTEIVLRAEEELGCVVPDEAWAGERTVGDLHQVLAKLLPQHAAPSLAVAQVISWVQEFSGCDVAGPSSSLRWVLCGRYLGSRWSIPEHRHGSQAPARD